MILSLFMNTVQLFRLLGKVQLGDKMPDHSKCSPTDVFISYLNNFMLKSKFYNRYQISYAVYSKQDYTIGYVSSYKWNILNKAAYESICVCSRFSG